MHHIKSTDLYDLRQEIVMAANKSRCALISYRLHVQNTINQIRLNLSYAYFIDLQFSALNESENIACFFQLKKNIIYQRKEFENVSYETFLLNKNALKAYLDQISRADPPANQKTGKTDTSAEIRKISDRKHRFLPLF